MNHLKRLLIENIAWANEKNTLDPAFFTTLAQGQSPKVLWLGCSDSRVPAESITNAAPGDLFVHRNIANLFSPEDDSAVSVLEYAVKVLKVADIIVCGHSGCGGVRASLLPPSDGLPNVKRRIAPLCCLAASKRAELDAIADEAERVDRLAGFNVLAQVDTLRGHPIVRDAGAAVRVHGWLFDLQDGRIRVLADGAGKPALSPLATVAAKMPRDSGPDNTPRMNPGAAPIPELSTAAAMLRSG